MNKIKIATVIFTIVSICYSEQYSPPFDSASPFHYSDDPCSFNIGFGLSKFDSTEIFDITNIDAKMGVINHNACSGAIGIAGHGAKVNDIILIPINVNENGWYELSTQGRYKGEIRSIGYSVFGVTGIINNLNLITSIHDSSSSKVDYSQVGRLEVYSDPLYGYIIDLLKQGAYQSLMIYFNSVVAAGSVPDKIAELVEFIDSMKTIMELEQLLPVWKEESYKSFTIPSFAYLEKGENYYFQFLVDSDHSVYSGGAGGAFTNTDFLLEILNIESKKIASSSPGRGNINLSLDDLDYKEINAVILYDDDYNEIKRVEYLNSSSCIFSNVLRKNNYIMEVYCWDMLSGELGPIYFDTSSGNYDIVTCQKRTLTINLTYSNGELISDADVYLYSWDGYNMQENLRNIKKTNSNGNVTILAWPTRYEDCGERYIVKIYSNENKIWENKNVILSDSKEGSNYNITTSFTPSYEICSESGSYGNVNPNGSNFSLKGTSKNFTAIPDSGYEVDHWYLDTDIVQDGGNTYTLYDIQESHSVYVTFKSSGGGGVIEVVSPKTDSIWFRGRSGYLNWEWDGDIGANVKIDLFKGDNFITTIIVETENDGSYRWSIPHSLDIGSNYRIKISSRDDTSEYDFSDFFTIEEWNDTSIVEIRTVTELQSVATGGAYPRDAYYKLMNDLDLSSVDNWEPIGTDYDHYFRGTFDGQGFTINNLEIDRPDEQNIGLFSATMDNAVIKNLNFQNVKIDAHSKIGTIVGENSGKIINCHIGGAPDYDIVRIEGEYSGFVGGIVGDNTTIGKIQNCSVDTGNSDIRSVDDTVGGIVGLNDGQIIWCNSTTGAGQIENSGGYEIDEVGGIAGFNSGEIFQCYSKSRIDGSWYEGGISGINDGTILDCYYNGPRIDGDSKGGIVGKNNGTVRRCYATGTFVGGDTYSGGLAGKQQGTFSNSFWNSSLGLDAFGTGGGSNCNEKTTNEMYQENTYTTLHSANWDFTDIWTIQEGVDYPKLLGIGNILSAPSNFTASTDNSEGIQVSWNKVTYNLAGSTHEAYYQLWRSDTNEDSSPKVKLMDWQNRLNFSDETVIAEKTYYYHVKSAANVNGARESEFSSPVSGVRTLPPASNPKSINASEGMPNSILVEWEGATNSNYYKVYRSNDSTGNKIPVGDWQSEMSLIDSPTESDTDYYYWVKAAVDDSGSRESEFVGPDIGSFIIPDNSSPSVNISVSPENLIETQSINISIAASDNQKIDRIILKWYDEETTKSHTWDEINTASSNIDYDIGAFSSEQSVKCWAEAYDTSENRNISNELFFTILKEKISVPDPPSGLNEIETDIISEYESGGAASSLGSSIEYQFDWSDDSSMIWGEKVREKSWSNPGKYFVKVRARSQSKTDRISQWSSSILVEVYNPLTSTDLVNHILREELLTEDEKIRADSNNDGIIDVSDLVYNLIK